MTSTLIRLFRTLSFLWIISTAPVSAQATWSVIPTGTQFSIHELSFPNDSIGYFVCDTADFNPQGKVYRTQNRGNIWSFVNYTSHNLFHIDAPSSNVVYVNGNNGLYSVLRRSVNAGQTWLNMNVNSPEGPMDFINDTLGFIVSSGGPGNINWRTVNSGNSFDSALLGGFPSAAFDVQFVTDSIAYVGGLYGPKLSKTTQQLGGWADQSNDYAVRSVCFITPDSGYATAENIVTSNPITVLKTTDGGVTWNLLPGSYDPNGNGWSKIHCRNMQECICVGGGGSIASTGDGGFTWISENSGTLNNLTDVFYGSNFALAVGEYGTVLRRVLVPQSLDEQAVSLPLRVYPNPAGDQLQLRGAVAKGAVLCIADVAGREMHREVIREFSDQVRLDISGLNSGLYFLREEGRDDRLPVKFIKE